MLLTLVRSILVSVVLVSQALATTWIVDASGGAGSQFTDIGAAINAASAGDVILVRPGTYPAFVTSKGLTILGQGNVNVTGMAAVVGVPAFERTALIHMSAQTVVVDSCDGPVILQELNATTQFRTISSADVRGRASAAAPPVGPSLHAFTVESSRVELVSCTLTGGRGSTAQDGGNGIRSFSSGRLFVVDSTTKGGAGGHTFVEQAQSGGGGAGIRIESGSSLRIAGGSAVGGDPGWCEAPVCSMNCCYDGAGAHAIHAESSSVFHSQSTQTQGSGHFTCPHCMWLAEAPLGPFPGTQFVQVTPDDPILRTSGVPLPGQTITFTVTGPPGAPATLWLGRGLIVNPTPPVAIEELVPRARVFQLGPIPASGVVSRSFVIPPMPIGAGFAAQAEVVLQGGEIRRTNSCPVVVR